jgi:hypothetical protein
VKRGLADDDRAGVSQLRHDMGAALGPVPVKDFRMGCRELSGDIEEILERDRHAVKRTAPPPLIDVSFGGAGIGKGGVRKHLQECIQLRVMTRDPFQARGDVVDRRKLAPLQQRCRLRQREISRAAHGKDAIMRMENMPPGGGRRAILFRIGKSIQ